MRSEEVPRPEEQHETETLLRRGRRLVLAEVPFASIVGLTISGTFLTALVTAFEGKEFKLGLAVAAGHVGALGMLVTNPILNRIGSRRLFCLIWLGVVRVLRMVLAALPMLVYAGLAPRTLYWPFVACVLVSAFFGMSAEISRRSWISDLVPPAERGRFFSHRVTLSLLPRAAVLMLGGKLLDYLQGLTGRPFVGLSVVVGFGAVMGWIGWTMLYWAPEPAMSMPHRRPGLVRSLLLPWQWPRFRPLVLVAGWYAFATGICANFFDYYMLRHLGMSWSWIAAVNTFGILAAVSASPWFGRWADRAGTRRVLLATILVKGIFPALWLMATPQTWPLTFLVVSTRAFNSASMICWLRLALNLSPRRNKAAFLAMNQSTMGLCHALGAVLGGGLAALLGRMNFAPTIAGYAVIPLHLVFLTSAVLRLISLPMLRFIHEPARAAAQPAGR